MQIKELILFAIPVLGFLITLIVNWEKIVKANWESLTALFAGFGFWGAVVWYGVHIMQPEIYGTIPETTDQIYAAEHPLIAITALFFGAALGYVFVNEAVEMMKKRP